MASLPTSGIVDGDGHILEPATLWEDYAEERFKARAIRVRVNGALSLRFEDTKFLNFSRLSIVEKFQARVLGF